MGTKPQSQREEQTSQFSCANISANLPGSRRGEHSHEATHAGREVLRKVDAALLFMSEPDAKILADDQGRIVLVNSVTEQMFGYGREELVGEPIENLMPERFRNIYVEHRSRYSAAPHSRPTGPGMELFGRHHDGHEFPIEISLAPLETEDGVLVLSAIRDVTNLKRT